MNTLPIVCVLLAEGSRWDDLSKGFSSGFRDREITAGDLIVGLLVLAVIVVVVWLLYSILNLGTKKKRRNWPKALFLNLCRAHRLGWRECWLLWRLARHQRLSEPARLFLESQRWNPVNFSPALLSKQQQFTRLQGQLFAEPPDRVLSSA
jgi:hypothetical protein